MPNTTPRKEIAFVGTQKANVHVAKHCAFKQYPNKKGKRKGRHRSPSPTGLPYRNSKGDGKGSDDGSAKGTPEFSGKSPSGKANRPVPTSRKEVAKEKFMQLLACSQMYTIQSARWMQNWRPVRIQPHSNTC